MGMFELAGLLRRAVERGGRPTLEGYARMADALLEAYRTGTPEAMERLYQVTWHRRSWEGMRRYVQLDLGRRPEAEGGDVPITVDDARWIVAREYGFASWAALSDAVMAAEASDIVILAKPMRVFTRGERNERRPLGKSRTLRAIVGMLRERDATELDAQGQMTDALLDQISRVEGLTSLSLAGSKALTDDGLRYLSRLPGLTHLDLSMTAVTDRGLEVLRTLPQLETVSLNWTRVTDEGMRHLEGCHHLRGLRLAGTACGDESLATLSDKPRLAQLHTGTRVTDDGLALLRDFPVYKSWAGGEITMGLTSFDAGPNYLALRGQFTDAGLRHLAGLDGLSALNIDDSELGLTAKALAPLIGLPNLGWLAFDAKDDSMPFIAAMPTLRFLGCQDTPAGDEGFAALGQSRSIEYIWGRRCHNLGDRGFRALGNIPTLRALSVSCKNVSDDAVAALPDFPTLRELMPMDIPDEGYRHIGRCASLESLVLMYCRETGDAATSHLASLPRLVKYFNSYTHITDQSLRVLSGMDALEEISIQACPGVTDAGVLALARLPRLRRVDINGKQITTAVLSVFPSGVRVTGPEEDG
jgi:hypothetical protein